MRLCSAHFPSLCRSLNGNPFLQCVPCCSRLGAMHILAERALHPLLLLSAESIKWHWSHCLSLRDPTIGHSALLVALQPVFHPSLSHLYLMSLVLRTPWQPGSKALLENKLYKIHCPLLLYMVGNVIWERAKPLKSCNFTKMKQVVTVSLAFHKKEKKLNLKQNKFLISWMYFNTTRQWLWGYKKATDRLVARNISLTEERQKQHIIKYTR